jgi:hypothetical protein
MLAFNTKLCFGLLAVACFFVPAQAATIDLTPTADVRILSVLPDTNEANGALLSVYTLPGNEQRTLIQFDLSSIPAGQQIESAILTLHNALANNGGNPLGLNMDVHAVTSSWNENEVTWNSASTGNAWTNAGGDFNPFVYATATNQLGFGPVTWDVTDLVQDWYDSSIDNDGLLIRSFIGNQMTFNSKTVLPESVRPLLQVSYSVPEASTFLLAGIGMITSIGYAYRRRRVVNSSVS